MVPGSDGVVATLEDAQQIAGEIGYPVMVKASAGGGGRGIRHGHTTRRSWKRAFTAAQQEALSFFGNDERLPGKVYR